MTSRSKKFYSECMHCGERFADDETLLSHVREKHPRVGYDPPSDEQRGLYWVWMEQLARELTMEKEEVHERFKDMFLEGKSSMRLHRIQFTHYMSQIKTWAAEYDIVLPEPNT